MSKNLINPKETICLLLYYKPKNVEYICNALYGRKRNSRVSGWLKELNKKGWIKSVSSKDLREHLFYTTSKCLLDSVQQDLIIHNITLSMDETWKLKQLFSSEDFRNYVNDIIIHALKFYNLREIPPGLSLIKQNLVYYCVFLSVIYNYILKKYPKIKIAQLEKDIEKLVPKIENTDISINLTKLGFLLIEKLAKSLDPFQEKLLYGYLNAMSDFVEEVKEVK